MAAVGPAREDDREFGEEVDAGFRHRRLFADRGPGSRDIGWVADPGLALAVIAVAPGLEHERRTEFSDRGFDVAKRGDRAPRRDSRTALLDELLLGSAVLRDGERTGAGPELGAERG